MNRSFRSLIGATAVGLGLVALLPTAPAVASGRAPKRTFGRSTSTNWSGYAVPGTDARHVIGTWTQPSVTCAPGENSWSSPWVGIDGNTSSTVEQIGTDSDCQNGAPLYYAWYEMYPKSLVTIALAVNPGDSFTGEVTSGPSGSFVLKLTNNTTHASYQTTQTSTRAVRSSVEWVMEGPSRGLLSNFGSVGFAGAAATMGTTTGSLGSFAGAQPITMVTRKGVPRAVPSAVTGGTGFNVAWQHG